MVGHFDFCNWVLTTQLVWSFGIDLFNNRLFQILFFFGIIQYSDQRSLCFLTQSSKTEDLILSNYSSSSPHKFNDPRSKHPKIFEKSEHDTIRSMINKSSFLRLFKECCCFDRQKRCLRWRWSQKGFDLMQVGSLLLNNVVGPRKKLVHALKA